MYIMQAFSLSSFLLPLFFPSSLFFPFFFHSSFFSSFLLPLLSFLHSSFLLSIFFLFFFPFPSLCLYFSLSFLSPSLALPVKKWCSELRAFLCDLLQNWRRAMQWNLFLSFYLRDRKCFVVLLSDDQGCRRGKDPLFGQLKYHLKGMEQSQTEMEWKECSSSSFGGI